MFQQASELLHPEAEPLLMQRLAAAARQVPLPPALAAATTTTAEGGPTWETAREPERLRALAAAQLQRELAFVFGS